MKITTLSFGTLGVAGLVAAGLMSLPTSGATAAPAVTDGPADVVKRDEDTLEVVLVADDDDDDTNARDTDTRTRDTNTNTRGGTNTNSRSRNDGTGTGTRTGRDDSRERRVNDWTRDGGDRTRDWSANQTNDRSRHNTRR
ncbi:hypothetical protein [Nocardioides sp. 1609]|uniref:hypothetical protein n=1 Tax=Nocardioides sp. 1609 TaxID=2508327 RepID=UPI00107038E9|nr:hypothetical protein [Nocardioides sp. 1609]